MGYKSETTDEGIKVVNSLADTNPKVLIDLQLEYIIWSSKKSAPADQKQWFATLNYDSPYRMTYEEYMVSTEAVGELALVFHASYERSDDGEKERAERSASAEKWYDFFNTTD